MHRSSIMILIVALVFEASCGVDAGQELPVRYTRDGENVSPPLEWTMPPPRTRSLVVLCDEPTSSLDAKAAGVIEELLLHLKARATLLVVSHNQEQVRRIADNAMELRYHGLKPI